MVRKRKNVFDELMKPKRKYAEAVSEYIRSKNAVTLCDDVSSLADLKEERQNSLGRLRKTKRNLIMCQKRLGVFDDSRVPSSTDEHLFDTLLRADLERIEDMNELSKLNEITTHFVQGGSPGLKK